MFLVVVFLFTVYINKNIVGVVYSKTGLFSYFVFWSQLILYVRGSSSTDRNSLKRTFCCFYVKLNFFYSVFFFSCFLCFAFSATGTALDLLFLFNSVVPTFLSSYALFPTVNILSLWSPICWVCGMWFLFIIRLATCFVWLLTQSLVLWFLGDILSVIPSRFGLFIICLVWTHVSLHTLLVVAVAVLFIIESVQLPGTGSLPGTSRPKCSLVWTFSLR